MKRDILVNFNNIDNVAEIPLDNTPNIEFDIGIGEREYKIEIRTLADNNTYITIKNDDKTLCNMANIKLWVDLIYFSQLDNVVFFFMPNDDSIKDNYNYSDFNNNIRLYYATI